MINNNNVSELIETHGPKGFGTYIMVVTELRHSPDYRCSMSALKGMARRCKISINLLIKVLNDFQLFALTHKEEGDVISSPYLDRVMRTYDERLARLSDAGKKRSNKAGRDAHGQFTSHAGALDKIRLDENKTTTTVVEKDEQDVDVDVDADADADLDMQLQSWEVYLDEAMADEAWVEVLAMNSGFSKLFVKYRELVVETFRQHVHLQGSGSRILSANDIKSYFANCLRPGTPTQKRIADMLAQREEELQQSSPYRFETIDPDTGERSYFGNPIPPDAPPRPTADAVWSTTLNQWLL